MIGFELNLLTFFHIVESVTIHLAQNTVNSGLELYLLATLPNLPYFFSRILSIYAMPSLL